MSPKASNARERMVETTMKLMRSQGYNGTGLNQIVEESKAPKGSLYHFFPGGKEHLAEEAVRQAAALLERQMSEILQSAPDVKSGLSVLIRAIIGELQASNFQSGCPISIVALETAGTDNMLQKACSEAFIAMSLLIEQALEKEGRSKAEARALANLIFCAYEGALLLSRTHHSTRPLKEMAEAMEPLLSRPVKPTKKSKSKK